MTLYEGSVRVPMVMAGPGIQPGQRLPNLVSLIDVCPTLIEMGGLAARGAAQEGLDGESLLPLATGQTGESRDWAYACFMGCTFNTSGYMLRKDRWKYVAYAGYAPQLFDIESDPGELVDLSATYPDVVRRLDADLRAIVDYPQTHEDWIDLLQERLPAVATTGAARALCRWELCAQRMPLRTTIGRSWTTRLPATTRKTSEK